LRLVGKVNGDHITLVYTMLLLQPCGELQDCLIDVLVAQFCGMQAFQVCRGGDFFGDVWRDGEEGAVACLCIEGVLLKFVEEIDAVVLDAALDVEGADNGGLEQAIVIGPAGFGSQIGERCCCCWSCNGQR
jgi:hypothetical protein